MVEIYHSQKHLKVSDLGGENTLPKYSPTIEKFKIQFAEDVPSAIRTGAIKEGHFKTLPYLIQDKYNRAQKEGSLPVIVLENSKLKATFYPQYGGRMASLYDKVNQKELLFDNPVFQPANLALRNAWFSGGIEWNGPVYGHTQLTCSPVYFAKVKCGNEEILRIYEYDRMLNTTWQVDLYLPDDSPYLWYHVTARNLNDFDIDYYWWTNIAAPVNEKIRFMVSSEYVANHFFESVFLQDWPINKGYDISYPTRHEMFLSLFYQDPKEKAPWFSYADENGYGLFHLATPNLKGKKLWYFGSGQGGTTWMDTLSLPGKGQYIEIQAGITETQVQLAPLAKQSKMSWTACLGAISCDAQQVHHQDYQKALSHSYQKLEKTGNFEILDNVHKKMSAWEDITPETVIHEGQAWGNLQEQLTQKKIQGLLFTAPITQQEKPWHELLTENNFSNTTLSTNPVSWNVSALWQKKIQESLNAGFETWLHHLHLATGLIEDFKLAEAKTHFERSNKLKNNFQALRGIAVIEQLNGNLEKASDFYLQSWQISNQNTDLFIEIIRWLIDHHKYDSLQKLIPECPPSLLTHEFLNLAKAQVALVNKQYRDAREHLVREYFFIREGESITTDIWFDSFFQETELNLNRPLHETEKEHIRQQNPPPASIDFRMR